MKRLLAAVCMSVFAMGCGPMTAPMPVRLEEKGQKTVDDAWEKALTPVNRHDNQALLDILITSHAYQIGVDKLEFRSENRYSAGTVVMEIHYERLAPEKDRFDVTILAREGAVLRKESYGRKQIEKAYDELFVQSRSLEVKRDQGKATPEERKKLQAIEARRELVAQVFPKVDEGAKDKDAAGAKDIEK